MHADVHSTNRTEAKVSERRRVAPVCCVMAGITDCQKQTQSCLQNSSQSQQWWWPLTISIHPDAVKQDMGRAVSCIWSALAQPVYALLKSVKRSIVPHIFVQDLRPRTARGCPLLLAFLFPRLIWHSNLQHMQLLQFKRSPLSSGCSSSSSSCPAHEKELWMRGDVYSSGRFPRLGPRGVCSTRRSESKL